MPDTGKFGVGEPVDLGAVVGFEHKSERAVYFLGPKVAGTEVTLEGREILVITPQFPLRRQLKGKKQGAVWN